ncbi:MAG: cytochrome c [Gammaproteobacteria bacterium]|nr:cytochrome c [Gammaproteobacteria bacterium]
MKKLLFLTVLVSIYCQIGFASPQTGWWWNEAESGRGFSIEQQGNTIFFAAYLYDDSGNPTWFSAVLTEVSEDRFEGFLQQFSGGQTLTGNFQPATPDNENSGEIILEFSDHDKGTVTWPGGTFPITRFKFGNNSPSNETPDPAAVARGSDLYQLNCSNSTCHTSEPLSNQNNILSGQDPNAIRSAFGRVQRMIDAGVPDRVSDEEVEDIAAFLKSIQ